MNVWQRRAAWARAQGFDGETSVMGGMRFDGGQRRHGLILHRRFYGPDAERKAARDITENPPPGPVTFTVGPGIWPN